MTIGSHRTRAAAVPQELVAAVAPPLVGAVITPEYRHSGGRGRRWAIEHRRPTAVLVERPALSERIPIPEAALRAQPALSERIPIPDPTRRWVALLAAAAVLAQVGAAFIRRRSARRRSAAARLSMPRRSADRIV